MPKSTVPPDLSTIPPDLSTIPPDLSTIFIIRQWFYAWFTATVASAITVIANAQTFNWEMGIFIVPILSSIAAAIVAIPGVLIGMILTAIGIPSTIRVALGAWAGSIIGSLYATGWLLPRTSLYSPQAPESLPFWTQTTIVLAITVSVAVSFAFVGGKNSLKLTLTAFDQLRTRFEDLRTGFRK